MKRNGNSAGVSKTIECNLQECTGNPENGNRYEHRRKKTDPAAIWIKPRYGRGADDCGARYAKYSLQMKLASIGVNWKNSEEIDVSWVGKGILSRNREIVYNAVIDDVIFTVVIG